MRQEMNSLLFDSPHDGIRGVSISHVSFLFVQVEKSHEFKNSSFFNLNSCVKV